MAKQKIRREEIASCPICQEQIAFKVDLQIDVPDDVCPARERSKRDRAGAGLLLPVWQRSGCRAGCHFSVGAAGHVARRSPVKDRCPVETPDVSLPAV